MNYQGAKIFLSIVEHQSISAAARALYITQPAVSAQLKTLEDELGVSLFQRQRGIRRITLTQEGVQFIPLARLWVQAEKELQRFKDDCSRTPFRIGATHGVLEFFGDGIMERLQNALPHLNIQQYIIPDEEFRLMSTPHPFDVAFRFYDMSYYNRPTTTQYYTRTQMFQDPFCIICPKDTVLPDRMLTPSDLDPNFQIHQARRSDSIVLWQKHFPNDIVPCYPMPQNMVDTPRHFNDPRCWALIYTSVAYYLLTQHPAELSVRYVTPKPDPRTCNLLVSKNCTRQDVLRTLMRCLREYITEHPELTSLLPDTI